MSFSIHTVPYEKLSEERLLNPELLELYENPREEFQRLSLKCPTHLKAALRATADEESYMAYRVRWENGFESIYLGGPENSKSSFIFKFRSNTALIDYRLDSIIEGAIHKYFAVEACYYEFSQRVPIESLDIWLSRPPSGKSRGARLIFSSGNGDLVFHNPSGLWLYDHEIGQLGRCDEKIIENVFFNPDF